MKTQIAKKIFLNSLDTMKKTLDLYKFKTNSKSEDYKYFKSQIMDYTYENLRKLFKFLSDKKVIKKCECGANLRKGYSDCSKCGGSGYRNNNEN